MDAGSHARYALLGIAEDGNVSKISPLPRHRLAGAYAWMKRNHPDREIAVFELLTDRDNVRVGIGSDDPVETEYVVSGRRNFGLVDVRPVDLAELDLTSSGGPHKAQEPRVFPAARTLTLTEPAIAAVLEEALTAIRIEFDGAVHSIVLVGSATHELTAASDLDIAVIFRDDAYPAKVIPLRDRLRDLAETIGSRTDRDVSLWPSRLDHYVTAFPDVSYVRANLPIVEGRLDAWCGLAKHTLIQYEVASAATLAGDFDIVDRIPSTLPRWEAVELFLLSTRTLAEGICELLQSPPDLQRGRNHVAKAALRASYAAALTTDQTPRNSYRDIRDVSVAILPESLRDVLAAAFDVKVHGSQQLPEMVDVLALMRHCEAVVAGSPRLLTSSSSPGRLAEAFEFKHDSVVATAADPRRYCRAPGFGVNQYQHTYFLLSARELCARLVELDLAGEILDFYVEEMVHVVSWALFSTNAGIDIPIGLTEPENLRVWFRGPWFARIGIALSTLADWYLGLPEIDQHSRRRQMYQVCMVLAQLRFLPQVPVDLEIFTALAGKCAADFGTAQRWQASILTGAARTRMMESVGMRIEAP
jgi:predicted nucleotidyltransferase